MSEPKTATASASSETVTTATPPTLRILNGIRDVVDDYDVFVLDMWGVMHDGSNCYEGVIECVQQLRQANKQLIILSNSSQRKEKSIHNLQKLGFTDPTTEFVQIITSGEVAFQLLLRSAGTSDSTANDDLLAGTTSWDLLTKIQTENAREGKDNKVFVLGSEIERDVPYVESSGWKFAPIEEADLILACGTFSISNGVGINGEMANKRVDLEAYETVLAESLRKGAERKLPMIVSNPDKVRPDYERPPMPGTLGDLYEKALMSVNHAGFSESDAEALVKRIGKPFGDVYDIALQCISDNRKRACMVGDALETDITGGSAAGIDTIWILKDGVYIPELEQAEANGKTLAEAATEILVDFNQDKVNTYAKGKPDQLPTVALPHFRW